MDKQNRLFLLNELRYILDVLIAVIKNECTYYLEYKKSSVCTYVCRKLVHLLDELNIDCVINNKGIKIKNSGNIEFRLVENFMITTKFDFCFYDNSVYMEKYYN